MSTIILSVEKRKLENTTHSASEPPPKKAYTENDVLDLSGKSDTPEKVVSKKVDDDVILLSEDEDEAMIDAICNEMEKENTPSSVLHAKSKALLAKIESELRNEESALLLLQQLRANQRAHSSQLKSNKSSVPHNAPKAPAPTHSNSMHHHVTAADRAASSPSPARVHQSVPPARPVQASSQALQQQPNLTGHQVPKVTKVMAIQALEQQCNGKKAVLQKHLEKNLDKVSLPRPASGAGPSDVAFVPSTLTNEFTALIGLEEIVHTIQDYDPSCSGKGEDPHRPCTPFVCANCGTDFTPVWKRKRSGSTDVVCEACIIDGLRSGIHRSYNNVVSAALKQYASSERELEHEYQDIVNSPAKLEAFIKEQERKLLAAQPPPVAPPPPQPPQPSSSVNPVQNQRYHQQQSYQVQNAYANVGARHPQAAAINSGVSGATVAAAHLSIPVANARRQTVSSATLVTSASAPSLSIAQQQQQNQVVATNNVVQQFATQYQQLTKAAAAAAQAGHVAGGSANVTANLMMAAAAANPMLVAAAANATNQQQQQQQAAAAAAVVQQRLAAAAALSEFQHQQQQQQQQQQSTLDQYARLQELVMNTLLCNAATAGTQNAAIRQPQHAVQQALLQYACLLQQQQQQQQAATQAQQQQQANAAALQQFMSSSVSNSAACMALLQSWWALNAAAGAGAKK